MERAEVHEFIKEVLGPATFMVDMEGWVSIRCPLAPWTHSTGQDTNPSAGVSVSPHGTSVFNCFTCHCKGPLPYLLKKLEMYTGDDWGHLIGPLEHGEFFGGSLPEWGEKAVHKDTLVPIDAELYLNLYDSAAGHPYLQRRGVSDDTAELLGLMLDPEDSEGDERILFPVYGVDKNLYGLSGRAVYPDARLKVRDYHGLKKRLLLLGSHLVDRKKDRYVILVEGLFDYAVMREYGQPAMAFMSSTLTVPQAEIVKDIGLPVYFFHDRDAAGIDARDNAKELLWKHVPVMGVQYPKRKLRNKRTGEVRELKDPAELRQEEVSEMLRSAKLLAD